MALINFCIYVVLLTGLTGSIWTGIWLVICRIFRNKGNVQLLYKLLKVAMTGYFIPFLFVGKVLGLHLTNKTNSFLFVQSPKIQVIFIIAFYIWVLGVLIQGIVHVKNWKMFSDIRKNRVPVRKDEQKLVDDLRVQLGIRMPVRAYNGYAAVVPFIYGVFQPRIYLPDIESFTKEEKEMILMHELVHYKHKDVLWKPLFVWICCIYWFNPFAWILSKQFQKWAEANCDAFCCERHSAKSYFGTIFKMLDTDTRTVRVFAPTWCEGESEFGWRLRYMVANKGKRFRKWSAMLVVMGIVMMNGATAYAAERGVEQAYNYCYWNTTLSIEEEAEPDVGEEYEGDISEFDGMTVVEGEVVTNARATATSINWTVANNAVTQSPAFTKSSGDTITILALVDPEDAQVKIGIVQPDGTTRYLFVKSSMSHTFSLTQSGSYRVFVSNSSGVAVTVSGNYR